MFGSGGSNPVETALLYASLALVVAGDLFLAAAWAYGELTGRRLLARTWSMADLFLGLQAVLGFVLIAVVGVGAILAIAAPKVAAHPAQMPPRLQVYLLILPSM